MKVRHSYCPGAKAALTGLFVLFWIGFVGAQGEGPLCTDQVTGTDATCNEWPNSCTVDHGCTGYNFQAACTGAYYVDAWITCDGGPDADCAACVFVTTPGSTQHLVDCNTLDVCQSGYTSKTCPAAVNLTAGEWYTLHVCLVPCPDLVPSCNGCPGSCLAHGCVRYAQTAPCW